METFCLKFTNLCSGPKITTKILIHEPVYSRFSHFDSQYSLESNWISHIVELGVKPVTLTIYVLVMLVVF